MTWQNDPQQPGQTPNTPPPGATPAGPPPPQPLNYAAGVTETNPQARTWGMFCHLAALAYFIPLGHILGPLIVWLVKRDEFPFVNDQGKESLNFQITISIAYAVAAILIVTVIGCVLLPAVVVTNIVFVILAAIAANEGKPYRYPICIRFIK